MTGASSTDTCICADVMGEQGHRHGCKEWKRWEGLDLAGFGVLHLYVSGHHPSFFGPAKRPTQPRPKFAARFKFCRLSKVIFLSIQPRHTRKVRVFLYKN